MKKTFLVRKGFSKKELQKTIEKARFSYIRDQQIYFVLSQTPPDAPEQKITGVSFSYFSDGIAANGHFNLDASHVVADTLSTDKEKAVLEWLKHCKRTDLIVSECDAQRFITSPNSCYERDSDTTNISVEEVVFNNNDHINYEINLVYDYMKQYKKDELGNISITSDFLMRYVADNIGFRLDNINLPKEAYKVVIVWSQQTKSPIYSRNHTVTKAFKEYVLNIYNRVIKTHSDPNNAMPFINLLIIHKLITNK